MKTGLSILAFALMAGMATAAERVLWSEDGIDTFQPEGIYDYNYKGANATKADVFVEVNYPAKSTAKPGLQLPTRRPKVVLVLVSHGN